RTTAGRASLACGYRMRSNGSTRMQAASWDGSGCFRVTLSTDPRAGVVRRHHISDSVIQKAVKAAAREAKIHKPVSVHTLRHHADNRIMPSTFSSPLGGGGDRAFPNRPIGIIRGVRERRAVDQWGGSDRALHRRASYGRAPAL